MSNRPLKIAILDCTKTVYDEQSSGTVPLGGIERCIISLSRALSNKGHNVKVFAHPQKDEDYKNIRWVSQSHSTKFKADIVIACNDPKLFDLYKKLSGHTEFQPYLWHHNLIGVWKTVRKGRLFPLLKWRPTNIFPGTYHFENYPKCLAGQKNEIIGHGVEDIVLNFPFNNSEAPLPHAAFISQPYRGLENLIQLWKDFIFPANPLAKLFVYGAYQGNKSNLEPSGIFIEKRLPREELLQQLSTKRLALIPGHEDETFCLSAIESQCLRLPVVSFGIGALKERINNGNDGYITETNQEFAEKTLLLLQNDALWTEMSQKAAAYKSISSWSQKAALWENLFRTNQK